MSLPLGFKYAPWNIIKSRAVMNLSPYCGSLSGIRKHWIILSLGLEPWPHCRYIDVKTVMPLPQIALNTLLIVFDLEGWNCTLHTQAMLGLQSRSPRDHTLLDRMNGCLENHLATQPKDNFSKSYHFLWVEFFFSCYDEDLQLALKVRSFVRWSEMFRLFFVLSPSDLGFPANFRTAIF